MRATAHCLIDMSPTDLCRTGRLWHLPVYPTDLPLNDIGEPADEFVKPRFCRERGMMFRMTVRR
jgi:hypothetical protein